MQAVQPTQSIWHAARRIALRVALGLGGLVLGLALVGGGVAVALWTWADAPTSLPFALKQLGSFLPSGQQITVEGATGTLRHGGHVDLLRWQQGERVVEVHDLDFEWQPALLWHRQLHVNYLKAKRVRVLGWSANGQSQPPVDLVLPMRIDLTFSIDALQWSVDTAEQATGLSGAYKFDGVAHALRVDHLQMAAGQYKGMVSIDASTPMALQATGEGQVSASVPGQSKTLALSGTASLQGMLAGSAPQLALRANLRALESAISTRVDVAADIKPWRTQPIDKANVTVKDVNLAALWPAAPLTDLTGQFSVSPQADKALGAPDLAWTAQGRFVNPRFGPWDRGQLPIEVIDGQLTFLHGAWLVQKATVNVGAGTVLMQGNVTGKDLSGLKQSKETQWQLKGKLHNIKPALLHTGLSLDPIEGQLDLKGVEHTIHFDVALDAQKDAARSSRSSPNQALRLSHASTQGQWTPGKWTLQNLKIQTHDASLAGDVDLETASASWQGRVALTLPGAQIQTNGQLARNTGMGDAALQFTDINAAQRWLVALSGLAATDLRGTLGSAASGFKQLANKVELHGAGDINLSWVGGWQSQALALQGKARFSRFDVGASTQPVDRQWQFRNLAVDLSGSLANVTLAANSALTVNGHTLSATSAMTVRKTEPDTWQIQMGATSLKADSLLRTGPWTASLASPVDVAVKLGPGGYQLQTGPATLNLQGPQASNAKLLFQPIRASATKGKVAWGTQGEVEGISLALIEALSQTELSDIGLQGDLVFDGQWDATQGDKNRLQIALQRRTGDITLQFEDADQTRVGNAPRGQTMGVKAGVREASASLTLEGNALGLSARWVSERAGDARLEFKTTLSVDGTDWQWPADAPMDGRFQAQLPQLDVWSLFAPPGWRIRGTVDANVALAGRRNAPIWSGSLNADRLALRAAAQGIDLSNGTLRSTLNGQRLNIEAFSLRGASGSASSGGNLTAKGFAQLNSQSDASPPQLAAVQMQLDARLDALRVSNRADQRLVVSGNLQSTLMNQTLNVRGNLKADQALFILADESAPVLGDDVKVRPLIKQPTVIPANRLAAATKTPRVRVATQIKVTLDAGDDFRVEGRGLSTRLAGSVVLTNASSTGSPRLVGQLNTVGGTYKAYGQRLEIEQGSLRFVGALDNTGLDVLAIRPNLATRVGVQITGTVLLPRVRLYSDPELPEAEKLAWLVLGRSAANGGSEAAVLQQAALALLGADGKNVSGSLADAFGLDEISLKGSTLNADGTTAAAAVTLGKRLAGGFYVAYERSLAGTLGTVYVFYDLSRRFTLRAQTGDQSALDVIFTVPFD